MTAQGGTLTATGAVRGEFATPSSIEVAPVREAPTSLEAQHARRVIVQITVGVDTGERGFYAVHA